MIAKKLQEIRKELSYIQKDKKITLRDGSYTVTTETAVLGKIRPLLIEKGLLVIPVSGEYTAEGSRTTIGVTYKIIDTEDDDQMIVWSGGQGSDPQDKGMSKAQTVAKKYLFLKIFDLITGDDPDHTSSESLEDMEAQLKAYEKEFDGIMEKWKQIGKKDEVIEAAKNRFYATRSLTHYSYALEKLKEAASAVAGKGE